MTTTNPTQRGHFRRKQTVKAPTAPEAPTAPHLTCNVLDADAWGDPLQSSEIPMEMDARELEVHVGDVVAARFAQTDARAAAGQHWLSLENHERLVDEHGFEDTGETADGRHDHEGTLAMNEVLVLEDIVRADAARVDVRGELEVLRRWAEARGRCNGMSADAIAVVTGRPYVARKMLLEPMRRARELDTKAAEETDRSERAEAAAAARRREEDLAHTVGGLHLVAIAVRPDRPHGTPEPWPGATVSWVTDADEPVYASRAVPGVACPPFDRDGVRSMRPSERVPPDVKLDARDASSVLDPDPLAMRFLMERRAERPDLFDMGPMPVRGARTTVPDLARSLCASHALDMLGQGKQRTPWRVHWLPELLVRSELRLRGDIAAQAILEAMDVEFRRKRTAWRVPSGPIVRDQATGEIVSREMEDLVMFTPDELPSQTSRVAITRACADAVTRGFYVSVGEPLEGLKSHAASTSTSSATLTSTKKNKKG